MKGLFSIFPLVALLLVACAQETECEEPVLPELADENAKEVYDSAYAAALGADEYGMHAYVMAFLKEGPNRNQSEEEAAKLQRAHLDNITRMAEEGKLLIAGPFMDEGELKGIYIFNVKTIEEAQKLTETDPAIKAGRLIMELHPWYGPATLQEIVPLQEKVTKSKI